jgi:hypothetical protein
MRRHVWSWIAVVVVFVLMTWSSTSGQSKTILQQSDFQFLGGFKIPSPGPSGGDTSWGRGFAIRNGRMLSIALNHTLDEWDIPTSLGQTVTTFPDAPPVRGWGNVFRAKWTVQYGVDSGFVQGMYWDPIGQRLY